MANLRANKITSTEVFETTGSVQFDGSGDYLEVLPTNNNDWAFDGAFTIEHWTYWNVVGNGQLLSPGTGGVTNAWYWQYYSSQLQLGRQGVASDLTASFTPSANKWYHIAISRDSSNLTKIFVDGNEIGSGTVTSDYVVPSSNLLIGYGGAGYFNGYLSNVRILKGTALYTKNFTPPTRELTVIPNTVLLACQSTTNTAQEATGKTITVNGNAVANELTPGLLTDVVKSGGTSAITGSVEFDGTGDYLSLASSTDFALGTDNWTVEWFAYPTSTTQYQRHFYLEGASSSNIDGVFADSSGIAFGRTGVWGSSTASNPLNQWNHYALVHDSTNMRLYINGVQVITDSNNFGTDATKSLNIGYSNSTFGGYFTGNISNFRILKGTALYTSNFIPPTRELKNIPGTVLLCCKDSNDPTAEETGKTITPYGSLDRTDLGVELITNGTFYTDTTGWTAGNNATLAIDTARLKITSDSGGNGYAYQGIATKIGSQYRVSFDYTTGTGGLALIWIGTSAGLGDVLQRGDFSTSGNYTVTFTATSTTSYIRIGANVPTGGLTYFFDNVSVTKLDPGTKPAFTPQVGSDGSVEFAGPTKINSENYFYLPTGNTESRGRGRGLFGGGENITNIIDYITIATTGNAQDFGDLTQARRKLTSFSSSTRGIFGDGGSPGATDIIDYVTIATTGNALDFGDTTQDCVQSGGCSNQIRGLFGGGYNVAPTVTGLIQYVTIATKGDTISFGDLTQERFDVAGCASPTRGIFGGGKNTPISENFDIIDYVTIMSTGNAVDFGNLTVGRRNPVSCSSTVRGLFAGGFATPLFKNEIDYITIASTGNAQDFGDLTVAKQEMNAGLSDNVRGVFGGGQVPSAPIRLNSIDYVTIASTGNAQDFGDLTGERNSSGSASDSHGGLG